MLLSSLREDPKDLTFAEMELFAFAILQDEGRPNDLYVVPGTGAPCHFNYYTDSSLVTTLRYLL